MDFGRSACESLCGIYRTEPGRAGRKFYFWVSAWRYAVCRKADGAAAGYPPHLVRLIEFQLRDQWPFASAGAGSNSVVVGRDCVDLVDESGGEFQPGVVVRVPFAACPFRAEFAEVIVAVDSEDDFLAV